MSRLVRIGQRMVELSGLDQIWLGFDHLSNSKITLYYPKSPVQTIEYKCNEWAQAEKDKKILEEAKKNYESTTAIEASRVKFT
jgi:hypothetical protein